MFGVLVQNLVETVLKHVQENAMVAMVFVVV